MTEMGTLARLYCNVSGTEAEVDIGKNTEPFDRCRSFVHAICDGCTCWTPALIRFAQLDLEAAYGPGSSDIDPERTHLLEQLIVDAARFRGGQKNLMVAVCTPIGAE